MPIKYTLLYSFQGYFAQKRGKKTFSRKNTCIIYANYFAFISLFIGYFFVIILIVHVYAQNV